MLTAKLTFVLIASGALVVLTMGLSNMTYFENTTEALALRDTGRTQVLIAGWLLLACVGVAAYVHSPSGAALALLACVTAFYVARTEPTWMPPLALLAVVPLLVGAGLALWAQGRG